MSLESENQRKSTYLKDEEAKKLLYEVLQLGYMQKYFSIEEIILIFKKFLLKAKITMET